MRLLTCAIIHLIVLNSAFRQVNYVLPLSTVSYFSLPHGSILYLFLLQILMLDIWTVFGLFVDFPFNALPLVRLALPSYPPGHFLPLAELKVKSLAVTPMRCRPCSLTLRFFSDPGMIWTGCLPHSLSRPFPVWLNKQLLSKHYLPSTCNLPCLKLSYRLVWAYRSGLPTYSAYMASRAPQACLRTKGETLLLATLMALSLFNSLQKL